MRIIVTEDYEEMSELAVSHLMAEMVQPRRVNIAITGGKTPLRMYEMLAPLVRGKKHFKNVHYYNFDEIPRRRGDGEGATMTHLRTHFYGPAGIPEEQIHKLSEQNYKSYDEEIKADGGLDLLILGLGFDGHFCGNSPRKTKWDNETVKLPIYPESKPSLAENEFAGDLDAVPDYFVTMGPRSVMMARKLVMIVNGAHKADIVKRVFEGPIDEMVPSTILKLHPNLTVIMDRDAAGKLDDETLHRFA